MKKNEKEGFLYAVSNIAMPTYLKIGYTNNINTRLKQLSNVSVPYDFELECFVKVYDASQAEATIHNLLNPYRVNKEFFVVDVKIVKDLFKTIENKAELSRNTKNKVTTNELISSQLINVKNPEHIADIIGKNKVLYFGKLYGFYQFINVLKKQKSNLNDWQIGEYTLNDLADDLLYE